MNKENDIVRPLLNWVGGKAWLAPRVAEVFAGTSRTYYEPFLGGGSVFLYLASVGIAKESYLADGSLRLINMYKMVQRHPEEVSRILESLPKTNFKENYYKLREEFNNPDCNLAVSAALLMWLNKTGFNGLYRENSKGKYNVALGTAYNPYFPDYDHIMRVSELLQFAHIEHMDVSDWMLLDIREGSNIYIDPPYIKDRDGGFTQYIKGGFEMEQQITLIERLKAICQIKDVSVAVSNHNTPHTQELYKNFNMEFYKRKRLLSAGIRDEAAELFCYL